MGRLDRYGEPLELDDPADHADTCNGGWLGEDHHGGPIPCLTCRPHLKEHR